MTNNKGELVPQSDLAAIAALDSVGRSIGAELVKLEAANAEMGKALLLSRGMRRLREMLTPAIMADIMELMNSPLGFLTDRPPNKQPYDVGTVKDVMVEAMIRGVRPVGNELNIIASRLYVTRHGFERLLRDLPGFSNLEIEVGVPVKHAEGALVPCKARWRMRGAPHEVAFEKTGDTDYRIAVRVNDGMVVDAIIGKATSKLLRRIYQRVTGTHLAEVSDAEQADSVADPMVQKFDDKGMPV